MPKFKASSVTATCKLAGSQPKDALLSDPVTAHLCLLRSLGACLPHLITMLLLQDTKRGPAAAHQESKWMGRSWVTSGRRKDRSFIFSHKNNMKQEISALKDRLGFPISFLPVYLQDHTVFVVRERHQRGSCKWSEGNWKRNRWMFS